MIEKYYLDSLLKNYGINTDKLVNKNNNILDYGEYNEIKKTLDCLIIDLRIAASSIEKCPSILYRNVNAIKENWEFLKVTNITIYNLETCLHVLSTEPNELRKTYNYVLSNYGITSINRTTSILRVPVDRIKEIEELGLSKQNVISAATAKLSVNGIKKIIKICKENNIEIIGSVFHRLSEEIEKIIKVCKENNIEITGSVFKKSAEEVEKIIKVCKENNIEITGSVFLKPSEEIEKIIEVCKENNIEITGSVFFKPSEEIEKIIKVCKENNIEITGSVFMKPSEEIEKIIKVCKENNIEITGSVFKKSAEEIEKIIKVCKENNIEIAGSVFCKKSSVIEDTIKFIKDDYDERFLKPLIINKDVKHLQRVFPYLESLGVLDTVINSSSILSLSYDEIVDRKEYIESIGEDIVLSNGRFNSVFGLSRKKYNERINKTKLK